MSELEEYKRSRARYGEHKRVSTSQIAMSKMEFLPKEPVAGKWVDGDTYELELTAGTCPCAVCNHEHMLECELASSAPNDAGCECCSSFCT